MRLISTVTLTIISLFMLVSCSKKEMTASDAAIEIRTEFLKMESLVINTGIRADYGDRVYDFTVKYSGSADMGEIEILKPNEIAGIKAEITDGGRQLVYDGTRMDAGALTGDGLAPIEAIPVLLQQWQSGYIKQADYERLGEFETIAIETDISETVRQKTWFDARSKLPVRAEMYDNGVMVLAFDFGDVTF